MKRFVVCILLSFNSIFIAHCQTSDETALFNKINHYRDSLGLNKLIWDTSVYKMAYHHTEYLCLLNSKNNGKVIKSQLGHTEEVDIPDFDEFKTTIDRGKKFAKDKFVKNKYFSFAENCCLSTVSKNEKNNIHNSIFKIWLESKKGHKEIMESKDLIGAACSIKYYFAEITLDSGVTRKILCVASVLDLY
jgi:hypothetical protein